VPTSQGTSRYRYRVPCLRASSSIALRAGSGANARASRAALVQRGKGGPSAITRRVLSGTAFLMIFAWGGEADLGVRGGLWRGRGFFEGRTLQSESIVLFKGLESVAVNAVGTSGLCVISIDVGCTQPVCSLSLSVWLRTLAPRPRLAGIGSRHPGRHVQVPLSPPNLRNVFWCWASTPRDKSCRVCDED
jgi:hypothetical protein